MRQSYFTMEMHPEETRIVAWREALSKLSLKLRRLDMDVNTFGTIISVVSPLGISFIRITSCTQELTFDCDDEGVIWLATLVAGNASVTRDALTIELKPGDIVYGAFDRMINLSFKNNSRLVFVRFPIAALKTRLITPEPPKFARLAGQDGIGRIFSGFLASVADTIGKLKDDEIWSIEVASLEFLVSVLVSSALTEPLTGSSATVTASLHRISRLIESRLSEPDLLASDIAAASGVSTRYLQKLFKSAGTSFGQTLRRRRLERCRSDIINPLYVHLSISDICFRWGFNDAAHFSRVFHEQHGLSPRDYRRQHSAPIVQKMLFEFTRGWPDGEEESIESRRQSGGRGVVQPRRLQQYRPDDVAMLVKQGTDKAAPATSAQPRQHHLAATDRTVHWGYFSKALAPVLEVESNDLITIETLTHHAYDDYERMIKGDSGAESVFRWTKESKNVIRRGAGPLDASVYGRGAGEGLGVHICTGPVAIRNAMPGDVVELRILDIRPRPSADTSFRGRTYGSNAATWWGFHYNQLLTNPKPREVITVYEIDGTSEKSHAKALYNFRWTPQKDPFGIVHPIIDYPGVPVDHSTITKNHDILKNVRIPVRPHFGVIALAPKEAEIVDSIPPAYFGGNLDNWRAAKNATIYLPVSVPGALLSVGDPHASQGDGEICGTAIECSLTGAFQVILHKKQDHSGKLFQDINYPLLETPAEWIIHGFSFPNYLAELSDKAQSNVYRTSSLDFAMQDAFRKTRRFLMKTKDLTEDEAISLISVAVDFGVTQVVNGNWCVHSIIRKSLFKRS